MFHINTQIPWHRLGPARVYTGTTAAFHDTRPLSPPPPLHLRLSAASPSFRPPYPPVSPPTLPRAAGEAHLRDSLPLAALKRPTPPSRPAPFPCPTRLRSGGQPPFPFPSGFSHLALRARRHRMLSQIARSFLTRVSAKGLLFLVLPCDLPPWILCTSTSSSFYTVTVLCLFLLLFIPFPISFSTSFLLFVVYHFYLSLFSAMSLLRFLFSFLVLPFLRTFSFSSPPHSVFFHYSSISSSIFRSSRCFVVFSLFTSSRSSRGYFVIFASLLSARFSSSLRADVPLHERTGIFCLPRSLSVL